MKKLLIFSFWLTSTMVTLSSSLWLYVVFDQTRQASALLKQQVQVLGVAIEKRQPRLAYAALPNVVSELRTAIKAKDARPVVIENYLKRYQSPMAGSGEFIVTKAHELGSQFGIDQT